MTELLQIQPKLGCEPSQSALEGLDDATLRDLIARAKALLDERAAERRKVALIEIRRLARENGLTVEVTKPKTRRGRPPKPSGL